MTPGWAVSRLTTIADEMRTCVEAITDHAEGFTCSEAEAFATVLEVLGLSDERHDFMLAHALGDDDDEDMHEATEDGLDWRRRRDDEADPD